MNELNIVETVVVNETDDTDWAKTRSVLRQISEEFKSLKSEVRVLSFTIESLEKEVRKQKRKGKRKVSNRKRK